MSKIKQRIIQKCIVTSIVLMAIIAMVMPAISANGRDNSTLDAKTSDHEITILTPVSMNASLNDIWADYTKSKKVSEASVEPTVKPDNGKSNLKTPDLREDVVVYFKEMPSSLEEFASSYGVKLIFANADIKMAAFETNPILTPGETSVLTEEFIDKVSKDARVESAERDWVKFTDPSEKYTGQKVIVTPEDLNGTGYAPDEVVVGFWRMPPSLEEFGAKYGGKLINSSVDDELKFATFNTSDMTGFINKVSSDPYVSSAEPNVIFSIGSYPNFS